MTLAKIVMAILASVMASKQCGNGVLFVWKRTPFPCSVDSTFCTFKIPPCTDNVVQTLVTSSELYP